MPAPLSSPSLFPMSNPWIHKKRDCVGVVNNCPQGFDWPPDPRYHAQEADDFRRDHLTREGVHRAENLITVMSMVIDRAFVGNDDAPRHLKARARVQAIAAAQAILGTSSVADIADAVRWTLQGVEETGDRFRISGPPPCINWRRMRRSSER